jgi:hypothetical protein
VGPSQTETISSASTSRSERSTAAVEALYNGSAMAITTTATTAATTDVRRKVLARRRGGTKPVTTNTTTPASTIANRLVV